MIETNNVVERLAPCPFCGNAGVGPAFVCEEGRWDIWQVECGFCDISIETPHGFTGDAARKAAVDRWNTRDQSLSDRIDVLAKLAGDVRWQELSEGAQLTIIDRIMLRDLYVAGQADG